MVSEPARRGWRALADMSATSWSGTRRCAATPGRKRRLLLTVVVVLGLFTGTVVCEKSKNCKCNQRMMRHTSVRCSLRRGSSSRMFPAGRVSRFALPRLYLAHSSRGGSIPRESIVAVGFAVVFLLLRSHGDASARRESFAVRYG